MSQTYTTEEIEAKYRRGRFKHVRKLHEGAIFYYLQWTDLETLELIISRRGGPSHSEDFHKDKGSVYARDVVDEYPEMKGWEWEL